MAKRNVKSADHALSMTKEPLPMAQRTQIIAADGLENVIAGLGTGRDKRSYSVYGNPRLLVRQELENMYRGSWLAKKIVNIPAEDMTREWIHIMFDEDKKKNKKSQFAVEKAEKRFAVKSKITDALKWSRLYGGAVIILGVNNEDLSKPLDITRLGKDCLKFLQVIDRHRISPSGQVTKDLESPNFGLPDMYIMAESTVQIHHSRVIRFNGESIPYFAWTQNGMWDDSSLQHVVESLLNADTTTQAVATMVFEANVDVIKAGELNSLLGTKGGEALVTKRFQLAALMKSFNRTLILDSSEEYEKKSNSFANLDKIIQQFMIDVCGAADIPMTRMFGQSAAGLSATGDNDIRNYYDMISSKQEAELGPQLEILYEVICRHVFGSVPEDFRIEFNPLWQVSDKEQAEIDKANAERDKTYLEQGVVTEGLVARELKERGTYRNMTDEDVALAEELAEAAQEQAAASAEQQEGAPGQQGEGTTPASNTQKTKQVPAAPGEVDDTPVKGKK